MSESQMFRVFVTDGTLIRGVHVPAGETVELAQAEAAELVAAGRGQWEEGVLALVAVGPGIHPPSMSRDDDGLLVTDSPASPRPMAVNDTVVVSKPAAEMPEVEAARKQTAPSTGSGLDIPQPGSVESASSGPTASMSKPAAGPLDGAEATHPAPTPDKPLKSKG